MQSVKRQPCFKTTMFPQNKWFDDECKIKKKHVALIAKQLQSEPQNHELREIFWRERKNYKSLTKSKKRKAIEIMHKSLAYSKVNCSQEFWNQILKATNKNVVEPIPVSCESMYGYFQSLMERSPAAKVYTCTVNAISGCEENILLDGRIETEEVVRAIKSQKRNKAPGIDRIPGEVFKLFNSKLLSILVFLFNHIMDKESYPENWSTGIITPIFKKGDRTLPKNYRGITLLPTMGKIFTKILRERLLHWAETKDLLNEAQFGFRPNRRTTDAIFILTTAIQDYKRRHKPVYACFVDFARAFDSVEHTLLWKKLARMGLSNKILHILQDMYLKATSRVKVNGALTNPFSCDIGVRQGCNLSPLLFILFVSDLETHLKTNGAGSISVSNSRVSLLMFADDVVLLAETQEGLQTSLHLLNQYCLTSALSVNTEKTKVVIFNKQRGCSPDFRINMKEIQVLSDYKYLGIVLSDNCSFKPAVLTLATQAKKALFTLKKALQNLHYPSPAISCFLFDALVCPIMEYGCEVWIATAGECLEMVHKTFCKYALGLPISATNVACYGELGRPPLTLKRKLRAIKYWLRLATNWDLPPLLCNAYKVSREMDSKWCKCIQAILNGAGYCEIWDSPHTVEHQAFLKELEHRLMDQYIQEWRQQLYNTEGKMRTYKTFKDNFILEPYLHLPYHLRIPLSKFRVSAHTLQIEVGRYHLPHAIPEEERMCVFCGSGCIETELHFLLECSEYARMDERQQLLLHCEQLRSSFKYFSTRQKFLFIMSSTHPTLLYLLAKYVKAAFYHRRKKLLYI